MIVSIKKGIASGSVYAPPSKSYAHRLLILSALSKQNITIGNVSFSEDILATLNCLKSLGASFVTHKNSVVFSGVKDLQINGEFNANESGSTLRFFIPIALTFGNHARFKGTEKLISRGVGVYQEVLKDSGISFAISKDEIVADGTLKAGRYQVRGDVSSQFITGLMFALINLKEDSEIVVTEPFESKSYVDITIGALKEFGIEVEEKSSNCYYIKGNQKFVAKNLVVEGDWSNSAFLTAFNYIGGKVNVLGLNENSLQGDKEIVNIFEKLEKGFYKIDLSNCPDLGPIAFTMAGLKHGAQFTGTKRLKIKESDRAEAMKTQLEKCGIEVGVMENSVTIKPGKLKSPTEILDGYNDHRIVMALSVLCSVLGGKISMAQAVKKSFPDFFERLAQLNIGVEYEN